MGNWARTLAFAAVCAAGVALAEDKETRPSFVLLPDAGDLIAKTTGGGFSYSADGGNLSADIFAPLRQTGKGWWLYDLGLSSTFDGGLDVSQFELHAGLVYRQRLDERQVLGFNAYLEGGRSSGDFLGQASLGVEYERRAKDKLGFVQLGGNYYIPFDDYTDVATYGRLGAAPRAGVDAYVSYGRDYDGFGLRGSVSAFSYAETDTALGLSGYRGDVEVEYWRGLPEGMVTTFGLGLRDDDRTGTDLGLVADFGLRWQIGNRGDNRPTTEDCAVLRDGDGKATVDCGESVLHSPNGVVMTKDGVGLPDDLAPSERKVTVNRPRRNIAYGSSAVPIEYKSGRATFQLVKQSGATDGTFSFTSNLPGVPASLTTSGGTAATATTEVLAGTYSIIETNLPAGWTQTAASCNGATATAPVTGGVSVTIAAGDAVVCTITNAFTAPPVPSINVINQRVTLTATPSVNQLKITKIVTGATAPAADFTFAGTVAGLPVTATGTGGPQTIALPTMTVAPGNHTIDEINIPTGFTLADVSCAIVAQVFECTFTNDFPAVSPSNGTIQVNKVVTGAGAPTADFTFTGSDAALSTTLTGTGGDQTITGTPVTMAAGTVYTISEANIPANFALTDLACTGGASVATNLGAGSATITLAANETVICTFTNSYTPPPETIQIVKQTVRAPYVPEDVVIPAADHSFFGLPSDISLSVPEGGATVMSDPIEVAPGVFDLSESGAEGFVTVGLTCTGTTTVTPATTDNPYIRIDLADGEAAVCTFVNEYRPPSGTVTITKIVRNPNGLDVPATDFTMDGSVAALDVVLSGLGGTATQQTVVGQPITVPVGDYTLGETALADGFSLLGLDCSGNGSGGLLPSATLTVSEGANTDCFVNNRYAPGDGPTVTLNKTTSVGDGEFQFETQAFYDDGSSGFFTKTVTTVNGSGQLTFNLPAGASYICVREVGGVIYDLNGNVVNVPFSNAPTNAIDVNGVPFEPDGTSCGGFGTFISVENNLLIDWVNYPENQSARLILNKVATAAAGVTIPAATITFKELDATVTNNPHLLGFGTQSVTTPDGGGPVFNAVFSTLDVGSYTIGETGLPEGWDLTDISCDGGSPVYDLDANTFSVDLVPEDIVTCTVTNTFTPPPRATFTLVKHAVNNMQADTQIAPPTSFSFTASQSVANATLNVPGLEPYGNEAYVVGPTVSIQPGAFSITENVPANWSMDGGSFSGNTWYCLDYPDTATLDPATGFPSETGGEFITSDGNPALSFTAEAGKNYVCRADNIYTPPATIIIQKGMSPRYAVNFDYRIDPDTGKAAVTFADGGGFASSGECRTSQVEIAGDISAMIAVTYDPANEYCLGTYQVEVPANAAYSFHEVNGPTPAIVAADPFGGGATGSPYATCLDPITRPYIDCGNFDAVVAGNHVDYDETAAFNLTFGAGEVYCLSNSQSVSGLDGAVTTGVMQPGEILTCSVSNDSSQSASDRRLKQNIEPLGVTANGHTLYAFDYLPGMGLPAGRFVGVMAQDLIGTADERAVSTMANGYYAVRYGQLGLRMVPYGEWQGRGLDAITAPIASALRP